VRRAAKVDKSQALIVAALRAAGAFVYVIGRPVDLAVRYRNPESLEWLWTLAECKSDRPTSEGGRYKGSQEQQEFIKLHDVPVWRTPTEALKTIGAVK
jgi:hypothetical protein